MTRKLKLGTGLDDARAEQVREACDVLADKRRRKLYDAARIGPRPSVGPSAPRSWLSFEHGSPWAVWSAGFLGVTFGALLLGEYDQHVAAEVIAITGSLALAESAVFLAIRYISYLGAGGFRRRLPWLMGAFCLHLCAWTLAAVLRR